MVYTPLFNYKYDSGPHQIQSGPNHEAYVVVSSGIRDIGADLGVIVAGPPDRTYSEIYNAQITTVLTIKVANPGSGNIYYVNNQPQGVVQLRRGQTFIFDQSDPSNAGHPLRLSVTSNGTHGGGVEYTTGVTVNGTPGTSGSYTEIVVSQDAPATLYYYCSIHSGMGGSSVVSNINSSQWYKNTSFRAVPPAVSGYWTNYQNVDYQPSGVFLSSYEGYRPLGVSTIANAKVQTSYGPQWGVRDTGKYTYFNGAAPSNQTYSPYNTPDGNTAAEGYTGGQSLQQRYATTLLTNPTNDTSGSRAAWVYNPPVYCQTFTETVRSEAPGLMSTPLRYIYRGRAGNYVSNYGSVYHQLPEGVRSMVRTYSASVNSSNQKK